MTGRIRGVLPPLALFAGLFFFGVGLVVLGTGSLESNTRTYEASELTEQNGTATLLYPTHHYGYRQARIAVNFTFPEAAGDAYVVTCDDADAMRAGRAPERPLLAFERHRSGSFVISDQTVAYDRENYLSVRIDEEGRWESVACSVLIGFQWAAGPGDLNVNRPYVAAVYTAPPGLDTDDLRALLALMASGAALAFFGGLAWARQRRSRSVEPQHADSTVEVLRNALDRMGEQLERTRRHLVFAGVLGIFLWYPFLVPWVWQQAGRAGDSESLPWALAGATLGFLVVLTILWVREFAALDRELHAWRSRMGELRDREAEMLDELEHGG